MRTPLIKPLLIVLALAACLSATWSCRRASTPTPEAREAAYRANNRGVALLEQFAYGPAVDAFHEALALDASLRLARINLPIALFYAGMNAEAREKAQAASSAYPDAPQPLFILGLIARLDNRSDEAAAAFARVLQLDPDDVGSKVNLALASMQERKYREAVELARSALTLEPYNATAAYNLSLALTRTGDTAAGAQALQRFEEVRNTGYAVTYSQTYLEQGRYAEAVASTGAEADLVSTAAPGARFTDATTAVLGDGPRRVDATLLNTPAPIAGGIALADIDKDGDLDVIVSGPKGVTVLRNDRAHLVDVTSAVGLDHVRGLVTGSVVGDVNNDSRPDLLLLTNGGPRLFAQEDGFTFREVNLGPAATAMRSVARAAAFVDVDHDGDLDILVGGLADLGASSALGWNVVREGRPTPSRLFRNNGNGTFTDVTTAAGLDGVSGVVTLAPTDFDNRRDIDLLMVPYGSRPKLFRNLRTGSFSDVAAGVGLPDVGAYTTATVGDVNKDGFPDVFFGQESTAGIWALSDGRGRFRIENGPAITNGAIAAQIFDYDNDGLLDLLVVRPDGPKLLRNLGSSWQDETDRAFSSEVRDVVRSGSAIAVAVGDLDLDGDADIVALLPSGEVRVWRNDGGSQNRSLRVRLTGRVSNHDGVGAKVEIRAGSLHQQAETSSTSPAVTPADILFGLGRRAEADVVRVLWPSGIVQSEAELKAAPADAAGLTVVELNRKPSSCPFLFTWNGSRYEFVTDFLGGGEMGSWQAPNVRAIPQPNEYVRISDEQLKVRNGRFEIRVTNELEEALFLDHLELLVATHPAAVDVFPDEGLRERTRRFRMYTTRAARPPLRVADEHGHDMLPSIARLDRRYVDDFNVLPIRGYASQHALALDLGVPPLNAGRRTVLLLTGWTDYAFSSDNVAASQSGLTSSPPILQARDSRGRWQTVATDIGFPVGRPQTLVVDVTKVAHRLLRILTNMRIYWDQIQVADATEVPIKLETLALRSATLHWRGFSTEVTPDGREPVGYDYDRVVSVAPWKAMPGRYTREGDVGELLAAPDDRFVVARPGDELTVSFDASIVAPLRKDERRTFLLHGVGYSKEMNFHSASPDRLAPMPFRAMRQYPYAPGERYPRAEDLERFHTRVVTRSIPLIEESLLPPRPTAVPATSVH